MVSFLNGMARITLMCQESAGLAGGPEGDLHSMLLGQSYGVVAHITLLRGFASRVTLPPPFLAVPLILVPVMSVAMVPFVVVTIVGLCFIISPVFVPLASLLVMPRWGIKLSLVPLSLQNI